MHSDAHSWSPTTAQVRLRRQRRRTWQYASNASLHGVPVHAARSVPVGFPAGHPPTHTPDAKPRCRHHRCATKPPHSDATKSSAYPQQLSTGRPWARGHANRTAVVGAGGGGGGDGSPHLHGGDDQQRVAAGRQNAEGMPAHAASASPAHTPGRNRVQAKATRTVPCTRSIFSRPMLHALVYPWYTLRQDNPVVRAHERENDRDLACPGFGSPKRSLLARTAHPGLPTQMPVMTLHGGAGEAQRRRW